MELDRYQDAAMATCLPSCENFTYMAFGLIAEAGEIADKVAKLKRKKEAYISSDCLVSSSCDIEVAEAMCKEIVKEVGDVMRFCAGLSKVLGYSLSEVAEMNLAKWRDRKETNTLIEHDDH